MTPVPRSAAALTSAPRLRRPCFPRAGVSTGNRCNSSDESNISLSNIFLSTGESKYAAKNQILKAQIKTRLQLCDAELATLAEIGYRLASHYCPSVHRDSEIVHLDV